MLAVSSATYRCQKARTGVEVTGDQAKEAGIAATVLFINFFATNSSDLQRQLFDNIFSFPSWLRPISIK